MIEDVLHSPFSTGEEHGISIYAPDDNIIYTDHLDGRDGEPQAGREHRLAGAVVAGEDQPVAAAGGVVVVHLEGEGGLAGVHRPGEEDELGHLDHRLDEGHLELVRRQRTVHAHQGERPGRLGA